jgi:general secretion pathway protein H
VHNGRPRVRSAGVTLIEIMIVVVIIALGASAVSLGLGSLTRTNLRSACVRLMSLSRYAYHRALTQGTTVRVTLDFATNSFSVSEAHGRVTLVRSDAPLRKELGRDEDKGDPGAGIDPWAAAAARVAKLDQLSMPASPFEELKGPSGTPIARFRTQPIGDRIRLVKVVVAHEAEPKEEGKVDLFFFPSGLTQHTVVQLADSSDTIFSVEIHPLTGKGSIHTAPYEPELLFDDPTGDPDRKGQLEDR